MTEEAARPAAAIELDAALEAFEVAWCAESEVDVDAFCARYPPPWRAALRQDIERFLFVADGLRHARAGARRAELPAEIGPYRVLRQLGAGGMGEVYLGEQGEPIQRQVAIKVVAAGLTGTGQSAARFLRRFDRERRTLARMNHDGIARVLQAGALDGSGRPWLAMEFVDGPNITEHCMRARLDLRGRVELMVQVCDAVWHAHQRGVVHRDLKPGNILVATDANTARATAKIIDFGLARAMQPGDDGELGASGTLTRSGVFVGTPAYMSPEQATGVVEVDSRTDVYSLGVVLYELLAGAPPFPALGSATPLEVARVLTELEPPPPSRVLPADRARAVHGDLDAVCLLALRRDRDARYGSVLEFGDDLRRWLRGEPVVAVAPTWSYRLRRFVSRHRAAVVLGAVAAIGLLVGVFAALFAAWTAVERRQNASLAGVVLLRRAREAAAELPPPPQPGAVAAYDGWFADHRDPLLRLRPVIQQVLADVPHDGGDAHTTYVRESLTRLDTDLQVFFAAPTGTCQRLRQHRRWARSVRAETVDRHAAAWRAALVALAADPRFAGVARVGQVGRVPLGADPASGLQEFAHLRSGRVPRRDPVSRRLEIDGDTAIVFVLLPGGAFALGAQADHPDGRNYDPLAYPSEGPVVDVTLAPFLCAKHELTIGQWQRLAGALPPSYYAIGKGPRGETVTPAHPADSVTWLAADHLLRSHGLGLPTEAQWEYACRAGTSTPWYTGAEVATLQGHVNLCDTHAAPAFAHLDHDAAIDDGFVWHAPVGTFAANPWGLHDMHGNVHEFCRDWYAPHADDAAYRAGDGLREVADRAGHVVRRGSFTCTARYARSAMRDRNAPEMADADLGARAVRVWRAD